MRVRVEQTSLLEELAAFLGSCNCRVRRIANGIVDVRPGSADATSESLRLARSGLCYSCGTAVEAALAELGSLLCHDCRGARSQVDPASERAARLELGAYLRVWNALHPGAAAARVDERALEVV